MNNLTFIGCISLFLLSCKERDIEPGTKYQPIFMDRTVLAESVRYDHAQKMETTGKIYVYGEYLFVVEPYKGIHFYNNTDPTQPVALGFLKIPGTMDLAIKNSILYADNSVDLVAVDISDIHHPQLVNRQKNVFPELLPPDLTYLPDAFSVSKRPENTVIIEWRQN